MIFIDIEINAIKFTVLNQSVCKLVMIYNNKIKIEYNIKNK